jgi:hypothetical protein
LIVLIVLAALLAAYVIRRKTRVSR